MFSRRTALIITIIILLMASGIMLTVTSQDRDAAAGVESGAFVLIAPLQKGVAELLRSVRGIWKHYFFLVHVAHENDQLKKKLARAAGEINQYQETELANLRLRKLLNFQKSVANQLLPAEVIGRDASPWYQTIIIDKGEADGVVKGLPVVVPEGIVGQVVETAGHYSKVLLIIDQNSAVDALVQRTRARGVIKGVSTGQCSFKYVLRKHDVKIGDIVVTSGLDGVFPKGLRIGEVSGVVKLSAGIFQEVSIAPCVDFEKFEEVLVILDPPSNEFKKSQ